jgi:chromosome partitioning protein
MNLDRSLDRGGQGMSVINTLSDLRKLVKGPIVEPGTRHARVLAIAARKGGVGKTTTTVNLGAALALFHNRKVLLVDMDSQGHVGMSLRMETRGRARDTLSNVLLQKRRDVYELVQPTTIDGLWFVDSDRDLNNTEAIMAGRIGKELLLKNALDAARTHFDVILIDCPPNLGALTVNALVAADTVIVPTDLSTLSLDGVEALLATIGVVQETLNPKIGVMGLLKTRVDRRNQKMNAAIEDALTNRYGSCLLDTCVGISTAIAKAQHLGKPVFLAEPRSRGSEYYQQLAEEIDARLYPH